MTIFLLALALNLNVASADSLTPPLSPECTRAATASSQFVFTKENITQLLQALQAKGVRLNSYSIQKKGSATNQALAKIALKLVGRPVSGAGLLRKATEIFGSWDQALEAAGIDASKVRVQLVQWSPSLIVQCIQALAKEGIPLHTYHVTHADSQKAIAKAIKKRVKIETNGQNLFVIARQQKYFGSWDSALIAAGFDPTAVRQGVVEIDWTNLDLPSLLRQLYDNGLPANYLTVGRDPEGKVGAFLSRVTGLSISGNAFALAIRRYYPDWDSALRAAGLDPKEIRKDRHFWTRELILKSIRHLHANGVALNSKAIQTDLSARTSQLLLEMTGEHTSGAALMSAWLKISGGSWDDALQAAELSLAEIRKVGARVKLSKDQVVDILKYLNSKGVELNYWSRLMREPRTIRNLVYEKYGFYMSPMSLYFFAYVHFETYKDALKAAKVRVYRKKTTEEFDPASMPNWETQGEWEEHADGSLTYNRVIGPVTLNPEEELGRQEEITGLHAIIEDQSDTDQKILDAVLNYLENHDSLGDLDELAEMLSTQLGFQIDADRLQELFAVIAERAA